MKIKRFLILTACFLFPLFMTTSCKKASSPEVLAEQKAFDQYLDRVFERIAASDTLTLNYTIKDPSLYGIEVPEPTLGEYTIERMQENYRQEADYLACLSTFHYDLLTKDQQLCYDMIQDSFELDCEYAPYVLYHEILGPTTGLQAQLPILLAEYNLDTKENVEDYLALLKDMPRYFKQISQFETLKSKAGLFMSDDVAQEVIKQCTSFIDHPKTNYLIEYFNEKISNMKQLTSTEIAAYQKTNEQYVLSYVIPAYESLIYTLNQLLGTGTNTNGLASYKNGKAYYEYLVRSETGSSRTIPELIQMLETALSSAMMDMASNAQADSEIASKINSYRYIKTDPEEILDYLKKSISKDFPKLPNVNCSIKYVHKSLQDYVSPAMYLIPQLDNYTNNCIFINSSPDYDLSEIFPTIAHEGYPGHLYQCVYFRSKDIHPVRNVLTNLGYEEGWATYAELYSYSIAGLDPNVAAILTDNMIATHCLYSRTDIGIHYENWDYEMVEDYLCQYLSPDSCKIIYQTLLEEPALYLPYSIGYLEIMDLKNTAQETLQEKFNLKEFHSFLLDLGPMNFDIIRAQMKDWMNAQ